MFRGCRGIVGVELTSRERAMQRQHCLRCIDRTFSDVLARLLEQRGARIGIEPERVDVARDSCGKRTALVFATIGMVCKQDSFHGVRILEDLLNNSDARCWSRFLSLSNPAL